jgi:hypothetical protein
MKIKLFGLAGRDRTSGADVSDYRTEMRKPLHTSQRSEAGAPQFDQVGSPLAKGEELDERPHALFPAAGRKSPGSG